GSAGLAEPSASRGLGVGWLVKPPAAGVPQWQEQLGCASPQAGPGDYADGVSVQQTADGGYVGEGPSFTYAGAPMHILAGHDGQPAGFAAMEITIPAGVPGPVPHAHDEVHEATTPKIVSNRLKNEVIAGPAFKRDS